MKTSYNFSQLELKNILDINNQTDILIKYGQLVNSKDSKGNQVKINYCIFPKLLFDDSFFETNYENSFFMHEIELPSDKSFQDYKKACIVKADMYEKHRKNMLYSYIVKIYNQQIKQILILMYMNMSNLIGLYYYVALYGIVSLLKEK